MGIPMGLSPMDMGLDFGQSHGKCQGLGIPELLYRRCSINTLKFGKIRCKQGKQYEELCLESLTILLSSNPTLQKTVKTS